MKSARVGALLLHDAIPRRLGLVVGGVGFVGGVVWSGTRPAREVRQVRAVVYSIAPIRCCCCWYGREGNGILYYQWYRKLRVIFTVEVKEELPMLGYKMSDKFMNSSWTKYSHYEQLELPTLSAARSFIIAAQVRSPVKSFFCIFIDPVRPEQPEYMN